MDKLQQIIEALIFSSEQPISLADLQTVLFTFSGAEISLETIKEQVELLLLKYNNDNNVFEITSVGGGYQFLTKPQYHKAISILLQHRSRRKLSTAALECLSIIAYSQPVTKTDIEQIRGVNCDHTLQKLLERDLIKITGRSTVAGRPLLYGTTQYFMDYFGINSIDELPRLKELEQKEYTIGDPQEIMINDDAGNENSNSINERREDAKTDVYAQTDQSTLSREQAFERDSQTISAEQIEKQ